MIYAATPKEIEERRRAFIRKWRLKCRAVADSLQEAGDRLLAIEYSYRLEDDYDGGCGRRCSPPRR